MEYAKLDIHIAQYLRGSCPYRKKVVVQRLFLSESSSQ